MVWLTSVMELQCVERVASWPISKSHSVSTESVYHNSRSMIRTVSTTDFKKKIKVLSNK